MNADQLLAHYEQIADAPDAISRLRRFILDLAVRGKLVEQDPADEPASELLKRLAEQCATERRRKSEFDPINEQELPFAPPPGWAWARFGEVFSIRTGFAFKSSTYADQGLLVFRVVNFNRDGLFDLSDTKFFPETLLDEKIKGFLLEEGEILMVMVGGTIGKTTRVTHEILPALLNQNMWRIRSYGKTLVNDYEYLLIRTINQKVENLTASTHGHFAMSEYEQKLIPLPPLAEQPRIVAKVDELMALCGRLETARAEREATRDRLAAASFARLNAPDPDPETFQNHAAFALNNLAPLTTRPDQIKALRQTILNLAVRGKLVEQDPADEPASEYLLSLPELPSKARKLMEPIASSDCGGDRPDSWAWLPLGAIIQDMDAGWSPQCENHPRSNEDEWGVLKTTAVQALSFDATQHKLLPTKLEPRPQYQAEVGDILVTRAGPKNRVGVSCVVDVPCHRLMISDKLIRFHSLGELSPRYIALTLNAGFTFEQIEAAKSGMAVMQMNISQSKLKAIPIPLPPLAEQQRIVAKVDALMALCDRLEAALASADTTRQRLLEALLHEALTPGEEQEAAA